MEVTKGSEASLWATTVRRELQHNGYQPRATTVGALLQVHVRFHPGQTFRVMLG